MPLDLPPTSALQKENAALKESGVIVNLTSASPRNRARHTLKFGVVGCARLELATNGLKVRCSTD